MSGNMRPLAMLLIMVIMMSCMCLPVWAAEGDKSAENVDYELTVVIEDEPVPLAGTPAFLSELDRQECCMLHFALLLAALLVTVLYVYERKAFQQREFEIRRELGR